MYMQFAPFSCQPNMHLPSHKGLFSIHCLARILGEASVQSLIIRCKFVCWTDSENGWYRYCS